MVWLKDRFQNMSIRNKILLCFLCVLVLGFVTLGLLYNMVFSNSMTDITNDTTLVIIEQANSGVETHLDNIQNVIGILSADENIREFCKADQMVAGTTDFSMTRINICNTLASFKETFSEIIGIAIISTDDNFISNEMYKGNGESLVAEEWYKECVVGPDMRLLVKPTSRNLVYYDSVSVDDIICVAKPILDERGNAVGLMIVDMLRDIIGDILENVVLGKEGFVLIVDDSENLIYSPVNPVVPRIRSEWFSGESGIFEKNINGENYRFIYESSDAYGWKVVGVFSLAETMQQVTEARNTMFIILGCIIVLAVLVTVIFSSTLVKPLQKLKSIMGIAQGGDLAIRFNVNYTDEIGQLGRAFNDMLDRLQKLMDMVYAEQKKKRTAELNALQAQIKPHFLYNTFDTIHWMAKKYGASDIVYVIQCLTNLFRLGLSKGSEIIQIEDEIAHVENYLGIQKIRYDILSCKVELADEARGLYVPKLILQPIVENSIYHGIKPKGIPGIITIKAYTEEGLLKIEVADDGVGMEPERVDRINGVFATGNAEGLGYGMFNVNERLKLSFGNEYGLSIASVTGGGTAVTVACPMLRDPEDVGEEKKYRLLSALDVKAARRASCGGGS